MVTKPKRVGFRLATATLRNLRLVARQTGRKMTEVVESGIERERIACEAVYTARTKRAVNSLTVERGPKGGAA